MDNNRELPSLTATPRRNGLTDKISVTSACWPCNNFKLNEEKCLGLFFISDWNQLKVSSDYQSVIPASIQAGFEWSLKETEKQSKKKEEAVASCAWICCI